jgi:hypothetical protein
MKVVGGCEISNFRIQRLVHFYTKIWSFSILNRGSATRLRLQCRSAATSLAPAGLGVRATRRPRPHAGRGVLLPHAPRPESWESSRPRACVGQRRTGRCAPRTAGPLAARCRTRAGRDGCAMAASPASRRRHREASTIKTRAPSALHMPHRPDSGHCCRRRVITPPLALTAGQPSQLIP